jgi:stage V sporulation protein SpoVS
MTNSKENVNGNVKTPFSNSSDPAFLAVKGNFENKDDAKAYVKDLAKAVFVVFQKLNTAKLRCIGAASLNNAIKATIIASGEAKKKSLNFAIVPSFTTVQFDGGEDRTAVVLEVVKI